MSAPNRRRPEPSRAPEPDAPPFDAPWQAQVFALTVALNESGHLQWSDWGEYFSRALSQAGLKPLPSESESAMPIRSADSVADNGAYYRAWVAALENLARDRQWALPLQLTANREAIRAYNGSARWRADGGDQSAS